VSLCNRPRIAAVIWDMDGTLIDSAQAVPAAFVGTVQALGGPPVAVSDVIDAYAMGVPEVILEHLLGRSLRDGDADRFYNRLRTATVHPYAGVRETVAAVGRRWSNGLFTGASRLSAEILLQQAGLLEQFTVLVGGDEVDRPKPAPDGVLEACLRLGHAPSTVAYVGDAPTDLLAARAAGAVAVAAGWGHLYSPDSPADVTLTAPHQVRDLLSRASDP
jgi:HAD superfamily hydrolase (TIGR01509 family)